MYIVLMIGKQPDISNLKMMIKFILMVLMVDNFGQVLKILMINIRIDGVNDPCIFKEYKKIETNNLKKKSTFEFNASVDSTLKLVKVNTKIDTSFSLNLKSSIKESEENEEYMETVITLTGDLNLWCKIIRYRNNKNYIDIVEDFVYVKGGENPGISDNTLVELGDGKLIKWIDRNKSSDSN
jgi:hypothetical protein